MIIAFVFVVGLLFGSFANVYFYRYPQQLSFVAPRSFCPSCRAPIAWYDNLPVLSFVWLGAQCRRCKAPISWNYPAVELLCGLLFAGVAIALREQPPLVIGAFAAYFFLLFLIAGTDLVTYFQTGGEYGIIPDPLVICLAAAGAAFLPWNPLFAGKLWAAPLGAAAGLIFMLLFRWGGAVVFKKEALGLGDVKLIGAIGLWVGWKGVLLTLIAGSLAGTAFSLGLIATRRLRRESAVPFGPFLALGALSGLFLFSS